MRLQSPLLLETVGIERPRWHRGWIPAWWEGPAWIRPGKGVHEFLHYLLNAYECIGALGSLISTGGSVTKVGAGPLREVGGVVMVSCSSMT